MYIDHWENVWNIDDINEYRTYLSKYNHAKNSMITILHEYNAIKVCDAACGFGANSLALYSNGFDVYGFDVADDAVAITSKLLSEYGLTEKRFKRADILETGYNDGEFDAVTAKSVLDHLTVKDCVQAVAELARITRKSGLIYASFDPLEDDDISLSHNVLDDGSFIYTDKKRSGLLFRFYSDDEIKDLFKNYKIILFEKDKRGNRHIIIQK